MKKKLTLQLMLCFFYCFTLYSCMHDDVSSVSESASKEYINKSLWKEDEKYIKNVMQVYQENEDKIKKISGTPYWDYASSLQSFDESFLMVPIVEAGRVVSVMQVPRHGSRIRFYYTNFQSQTDFFQTLIFAKYKKALSHDASSETDKTIVCKTVTVAVWLPDSESNPDPGSGAGHWGVHSVIKCKQVLDNCSGVVGPDGQCITGGNTDDPGDFSYPGGGGDNPETPDVTPCEQLASQTSSPAFKSNITTLEGKTGESYESGFRIGINADGSTQNQILQNKLGTKEVNMTIFSNTSILMHSHYDGLYPIFSPGDILFFNQWISWAQNWNSVATNNPKIPLNNLTFTLVTSQGNYSLTFDGTNTTPFPNYTQQQFNDINDRYMKLLDDAVSVGNVSGNTSFDMEKTEKGFLKFMNDKMNMPGVKLYRTSENGNTEVKLVNGNRTEAPCP
ncbi:hypothetical protein M2347_001919 [Chryseobacterium sp. H1D6B]|uniref:hypothetical protein n=1 Tax=Chryseobacterium sp. H1D6B TaxID=2940588 RepID=UPI0015C7445E|nr:hypothetical protein [Chryseobacterium sp. H1D6B]MDH6252192.1 hypothetical protein [Chryseobacterium sp. H1D6B]